jgi:hypothetical protein
LAAGAAVGEAAPPQAARIAVAAVPPRTNTSLRRVMGMIFLLT